MAGRHDGIELPQAGAGRLSGRELSEVCQQLLDSELRNGLVQGRDYTINLQVGLTISDSSNIERNTAFTASLPEASSNRLEY